MIVNPNPTEPRYGMVVPGMVWWYHTISYCCLIEHFKVLLCYSGRNSAWSSYKNFPIGNCMACYRQGYKNHKCMDCNNDIVEILSCEDNAIDPTEDAYGENVPVNIQVNGQGILASGNQDSDSDVDLMQPVALRPTYN